MACSDAPEGHAKWSACLLASRAVALEVVKSVSESSVRRLLYADIAQVLIGHARKLADNHQASTNGSVSRANRTSRQDSGEV